MSNFNLLRKFIKEEIGRNYHTIDNTPYTFDDFQDYTIEIDGSGIGEFYLNIYYEKEKIVSMEKFSSYEDAHHKARMVIDKDRVYRMNSGQKEKDKKRA